MPFFGQIAFIRSAKQSQNNRKMTAVGTPLRDCRVTQEFNRKRYKSKRKQSNGKAISGNMRAMGPVGRL